MSAFQQNTLAAQSQRTSSQFAREWPWIAAASAYLLIFYVLPPPAPIEAGTDQSYFALLAELFLRGAQFGRDVIFTMGPWGFLQQPRGNPDILGWALFGRSVLAIGASVGAGSLAARQIASPGIRALWLLAFLILADPAYLVVFLLFATSISDYTGKEDWRYLFLIPACGLAGDIKFTALILVVSLSAFLFFDCIAGRRRFPWTPVGLILSVLMFHLLAKQRLGSILDYIQTSLSITASYSAVFSTPGSFLDLGVGCLLCGVVPLAWIAGLIRARQWKVLPLSVWVFGYFFLNFKYAFVRSDPFHVLWGMFDMVIPASLVLLILLSRLLRTTQGAGVTSKGVVAASPLASPLMWVPAATMLAAVLVFGRYLPESYRVQGTIARLERIPLTFNAPRRREVFRREIAQLQREHPLGHLDGTVSVFGFQLYILPAWNLNLRTLPLLQSLEAQNRELTEKDADFLSGPNAPDHVLFSADTIDKHLPSLEDSLAWLSLLNNYDAAGLCGDYLDLRKRAEPRVTARELVLDKSIAFGEQLSLPPEFPLWAEAEVKFNSLGRLAGLLLKLPAIKLFVDSGTAVRDYRVYPDTASAGFLLSPVVENAAELGRLYSGQTPADTLPRRISFRISPAGGQRLFRPGVRIRIYRLRIAGELNSLAAAPARAC